MMINSFQLVILFQTVFTHICCSQKASASVCYGKGVCSSFFGQRDSERAVPHLVWFCQGWAETKTWASAAGLCSRWFQQTPESESQGSDKHCPFKSCPRSPDLSACVSVFLVQQPKTFSLFCAATRALRWRGRVYVFFFLHVWETEKDNSLSFSYYSLSSRLLPCFHSLKNHKATNI